MRSATVVTLAVIGAIAIGIGALVGSSDGGTDNAATALSSLWASPDVQLTAVESSGAAGGIASLSPDELELEASSEHAAVPLASARGDVDALVALSDGARVGFEARDVNGVGYLYFDFGTAITRLGALATRPGVLALIDRRWLELPPGIAIPTSVDGIEHAVDVAVGTALAKATSVDRRAGDDGSEVLIATGSAATLGPVLDSFFSATDVSFLTGDAGALVAGARTYTLEITATTTGVLSSAGLALSGSSSVGFGVSVLHDDDRVRVPPASLLGATDATGLVRALGRVARSRR